jgi:hypothetical protein
MSQRHRSTDASPPPKQEQRAQAHGERHRIRSELQDVADQVSAGLDPEDCDEPGAAWKPAHHRDPEVAREKAIKKPKRHWKLKMWKRRSAARQAKAEAARLAGES